MRHDRRAFESLTGVCNVSVNWSKSRWSASSSSHESSTRFSRGGLFTTGCCAGSVTSVAVGAISSAATPASRTGARDATRSTSADSIGLKGLSSLGARFAILLRRSDLRLFFFQRRKPLFDLSREFTVRLCNFVSRLSLKNRLPLLLGLRDDN